MNYKSLAATTCCVASALTLAAPLAADASPVAGAASIANVTISSEVTSSSPTSGISLVLSQYISEINATDAVGRESTDVSSVKAAEAQELAQKDETEVKEEKTKEEKVMIVAQVKDYVNVRAKADSDSKLVGKLYNNAVGTVIKEVDGWYKIKSGDVTGFVKADYVVTADKALLKKVSTRVATVEADGLRVRSKADTDAKVMSVVREGEELTIVSESKAEDGWVKVTVGNNEGYVATDYVAISTEYEYAESREAELERLAEEQEEREAAERARQAAEAEQQNQNNNNNNNNTNNNNNNSNNNNNNESKPETPSKPEKTYSAPSGQSGQAVVNYACQFVGNPYVYGGSSLTNGTDCSGFVMSVYKAFGVSLPHSSSALRSVGRGVSLDEIQPGDIVCYNGHVALYAGNNTIVHASTRATGIKYTSPVNYRSIVAIRRIF